MNQTVPWPRRKAHIGTSWAVTKTPKTNRLNARQGVHGVPPGLREQLEVGLFYIYHVWGELNGCQDSDIREPILRER